MSLDRAIKEFLRYIATAKGLSKYTLRNYRSYLERFASWAKDNQINKVEQISREDVEQWQFELGQRENIGRKTQNYYLIALRSLLKYLNGREVTALSSDKITLAKTPQRQIDFLQGDEVERLLSSVETKSLANWRDKAIISLLFSSGLRLSELSQLKKTALNLERGESSVRGKGGKVRPIFMSTQTQAALKSYLDRRTDTNPHLFIRHFKDKEKDSQAKNHLSDRSIQRLIRHYALKAGLTKLVTPHKLRHTFATDLLRNGADLRSVQALLGHSSITTTQIYTHVTDQSLKEIHQKFHGQAKKDSSA